MVRLCRTLSVSYLYDCFMEEAYEEGFNVIFNYGSGRRLQGPSWGALIFILKNIFEPYVPPYIPLGGSKTRIESSALPFACSLALAALHKAMTYFQKQLGFFFFFHFLLLLVLLFLLLSLQVSFFSFFFLCMFLRHISGSILGYVIVEV